MGHNPQLLWKGHQGLEQARPAFPERDGTGPTVSASALASLSAWGPNQLSPRGLNAHTKPETEHPFPVSAPPGPLSGSGVHFLPWRDPWTHRGKCLLQHVGEKSLVPEQKGARGHINREAPLILRASLSGFVTT